MSLLILVVNNILSCENVYLLVNHLRWQQALFFVVIGFVNRFPITDDSMQEPASMTLAYSVTPFLVDSLTTDEPLKE